MLKFGWFWHIFYCSLENSPKKIHKLSSQVPTFFLVLSNFHLSVSKTQKKCTKCFLFLKEWQTKCTSYRCECYWLWQYRKTSFKVSGKIISKFVHFNKLYKVINGRIHSTVKIERHQRRNWAEEMIHLLHSGLLKDAKKSLNRNEYC